MNEKFYNCTYRILDYFLQFSGFAILSGLSLVLAAAYSGSKDLECRLQETNIIGSEIPDKFYFKGGNVVIYEIDKKPAIEYVSKVGKDN